MPTPLPTSPDVERALLAALMREGQPLPDGLRPFHFNDPRHRDIARAIDTLAGEAAKIDELVVADKTAALGSPVDRVFIFGLGIDNESNVLNPDWSRIIIRDWNIGRIVTAATRAAEEARLPGADPIEIAENQRLLLKAIKADGIDTSNKTAAAPETEIMGHDDLLAFDADNDPNCVIGRRWLCKGGSLILVGQAGTGKSSLMMGLAVALATKRPWFGIEAKAALRVGILQAENDFGDTAEQYRGAVAGANLHPPEIKLLSENLVICRNVTATGPRFPELMEQLIRKHDLQFLFVDPILSFAGIDVSDQKEVTEFLRMQVNPVLKATGCILCAMAHTPKPRSAGDRDGETQADLAYAMQGSSEWSNYFREVGCLFRQQGEAPIFKLSFTKRKARSGMRNVLGDYASEIYIRHAREPGVIKWEYASTDEIAPKAIDARQPAKGPKTPLEGSQKPVRLG